MDNGRKLYNIVNYESPICRDAVIDCQDGNYENLNEKFDFEQCRVISADDKYIYVMNQASRVFRTDLDLNHLEQIYELSGHNTFFAFQDTVFYSVSNGNGRDIYRMNCVTKEKILLLSADEMSQSCPDSQYSIALHFQMSNSYLYISASHGSYIDVIYQIALDGSESKEIYRGDIDKFFVYKDYCYISTGGWNGKDNANIYKTSLKTGQVERISGFAEMKAETQDTNWILIQNYDESGGNLENYRSCSNPEILQ